MRELLKETGYPGMKVMIFGLTEDNEHSPQNWPEHVIAYTSTHDSEPIRAAIDSLSKEQYNRVAKSLKINKAESIGMSVIKAAYDTKAETVIVPMPDVLSCSWEARINTPGKDGPENWSWRPKEMFSKTIADKMASLVAIYK